VTRCDFCSAPDPEWWYHAQPFSSMVVGVNDKTGEAMTRTFVDDGEWAACSDCKAIIESGDHEALAERSMTSEHHVSYREAIGGHAELIRNMLRKFHGEFWRTKISPPEPLPKGE